MNYRKYILALLLAFSASSMVGGWRSIIIDCREGSPYTVNLSDSLSLRFTADSMLVRGAGADMWIPLDRLRSFHMSQDPVDNGGEDEDDSETSSVTQAPVSVPLLLQFDGRRIMLPESVAGEEAILFTSDGRAVPVVRDGAGISLNALAKGVYVLKISDTDFKFVIR